MKRGKMFRCQFCGSHIFIGETVEWRDLLGLTECKRAFEKKHQAHQDASFYKFENGAELVFESDSHALYRVGEMRYFNQDQTIRYTQDLLKAGIVHDIALEMAFKKNQLEMIHNPWFELAYKGQDDGIVFDNLDDGLKELFRVSRIGGLTTIGEAVADFLDTKSN